MGRPVDRHINEQELEALALPLGNESTGGHSSSLASIREAESHLASCAECRRTVSQYRQLVNRSHIVGTVAGTPQSDCPTGIDWQEVADGLWPELRTQQLIAHAARCAHCGPLLRAATSVDDPTPQEEEFLARLKAPSRPALQTTKTTPVTQPLRPWQRLMDWKILVPACALLVVVAVFGTNRASSSAPISGMELAQFAASTHEQHVRGNLALELQTDSQPLLNAWLHEKPQFSVALPGSSEEPPAQLPYRIEGARLVQSRNQASVYIAYRMQPDPVSLIIAPISAAVASGGVESVFQKVTFHYYNIQGSKVVTWSVHGLTYALVSQEGNATQRSCMVCHSTMRDRDLSNTSTPLLGQKNLAHPAWK